MYDIDPFELPDPTPVSRRAIMLMFAMAALLLTSSLAAAQEVSAEGQPPAAEAMTGSGEPAGGDDAVGQSVVANDPSGGPAQPVAEGEGEGEGEGRSAASVPAATPDGSALPAGAAVPVPGGDIGTAEPPAAEPMPSPFADPLASLRWLLARPDKVPGQGHDLSPWGMFRAADIVVKLVMLGLAFASLVTWTVWLAKSLELWGARRRLRAALKAILGAQSLDEALAAQGRRRGPAATMLRVADDERRRSGAALAHAGGDGLERRVSSALLQVEAAAGRRISRGTGVLATIGSTAPFVGLFGTVWGIMNSFVGIAESNTTNLAVVAPGIAEALLATAIGLVAAIPAVVIYNVFARAISGWRQELGAAASGIERLVSRDLDFRQVPPAGGTSERGENTGLLPLAAE